MRLSHIVGDLVLSCLVAAGGAFLMYKLSGQADISRLFAVYAGILWFVALMLAGRAFWDVGQVLARPSGSVEELRTDLVSGLRHLEARVNICPKIAEALLVAGRNPFHRNRIAQYSAALVDEHDRVPRVALALCVTGTVVGIFKADRTLLVLTALFAITVGPLVFITITVRRRFFRTQYERARRDAITHATSLGRICRVLDNRVVSAEVVQVEDGLERIRSCCYRCLRTNKIRVESGQPFVCLVNDEGAVENGPRFWVDEAGRIVER